MTADVLREELAVYRKLKPLIARCLKLNHEINNPLAGILGYSEYMLLESDQLPEGHVQNLQEIFHCAERIKDLIDDLCRRKISLSAQHDIGIVLRAIEEEGERSDQMV